MVVLKNIRKKKQDKQPQSGRIRRINMTNSFKRFPKLGICGDTGMGQWKRSANRALRRVNKTALVAGKELFKIMDEVANLYDSPADGWQWINKKGKELKLTRAQGTIRYKNINKWLRK